MKRTWQPDWTLRRWRDANDDEGGRFIAAVNESKSVVSTVLFS
jgi:hypothetical protein